MQIVENTIEKYVQIGYELQATRNDRLFHEAVIETANQMGLQGKEITLIESLPMDVMKLYYQIEALEMDTK
jgi:hypothetical protein